MTPRPLNDVFEDFLRAPIQRRGRKTLRSLSTRRKYRYKLADFLARYGECDVNAIGRHAIEAWFADLEQAGHAPGNLAFYRSCFVAFFRYVALSRDDRQNIADGLPRYEQRPATIQRADLALVERVLTCCEQLAAGLDARDRRDAAIFTVATAGLRASNVRSMSYAATVRALERPEETARGWRYVIPTGGKEAMECVLDERRAATVIGWIRKRPAVAGDALFVNLYAGSHTARFGAFGDALGAAGITKARTRVCKLAGVSTITFQEIRRAVGTYIARRHGLETAAGALGHRSGTRVIRDHYYDPDVESQRDAVMDALGAPVDATDAEIRRLLRGGSA